MGLITVVGAGLLKNQLTFAAAEVLSGGGRILLHTDHIGCAEWLKEQGIAYESLDALYDAHEDFDEHAEEAAACVLKAAAEGDVVYDQPIFKVQAVDTTAAGDTFTGYFLAGLMDGMPIPEILKMSAKASSIAVTRKGAVQSIPMRAEVMEALKEL